MRLRSGVFARAAPVPKMPGGLVELMEGMTRDVLRHNPPDVLEFCAQHMEQLILIRDGRAPPKQRLTLEQKIKRAQEKVRERAEQRRIKYDEEMKKLHQGSSFEEVNLDISGQAEKPILKEEENSAHPVIEAKLKAPVHHEQDLEEALEVEIFHKPVEETRGIITTESKDSNEISQKQSMERNDNVNENIENIRTSEEPNHLGSEENEIISLADNDLTGLLEQVIINENISQDSHDHVRIRRSVSLKDNDEDAEKQKYSNDIADDFKPDLQNNNQTGEVTNTSENDHNGGKEDLIEHTNKDYNDTELKDIITNTTDAKFNCAPDTGKTSPDDVKNSNDGDSSYVTKDGDKTETLIKLSERDSAKELTMIENFPLDDSLKNTVQTDENLEKLESLEASTEVENTNNENAYKDEMTKNILKIEIANDDTSHEEEEFVGQSTTQGDINISATANENYSVKEKSEFTTDTKSYSELNDDNDTIIEKSLENIIGQDCDSIKNQLLIKSETNGNSNVEPEKVILLDDEKIIKAIDELEVCFIPIGICSDNKDEGLNMDEKFTSEDNSNIVEEQPTEAPVDKEELVIETESVTKENSDGAITSINKNFVDEPSGVKDDNYSVPEQHMVENTSTEDNTIHMNGTNEISNLECIENGNESPRREIIPNQDDTKEVEIISEIQDDVTNTSDPLKTDLETSSLGKSSSMDDSFIDEGVDIITESDEMKPSSEQSKPNQSGMDLETAAITIQKVFRTFLFKSRESTSDDTGMGGNSIDGDSEKTEVEFPVTTAPLNKERRTMGISRMDTVLQTVNEEKSLSLSDDSSLSSAATIIQAHVRGFLTRNRLNSNKTNSSSLVNSDGPSSTSFENDLDQKANKTVLNIHIVPEGEHFLSRDESLLTSMELSLDGSPPTSTNLHPLGYDKSEPRKQLKREDAIQSISPPSNNSGKLSEDIDSVKDMPIIDSDQQKAIDRSKDETCPDADIDRDDTPTKSTTIETVIEAHKLDKENSSTAEPGQEVETVSRRERSFIKVNSDEGDVVTPFEDKSSIDSDATSRLLHSGEFHDVVLPTKVSRGDTSVVRAWNDEIGRR